MYNENVIKVVLDTNIIISAAVSKHGNPAKIFELILSGKIKNYTSQEIINEVKEVIERERISKLLTPQDIKLIMDNFINFSDNLSIDLKLDEIKEDPDDNKFLECALIAGAGYIISGDEHLLNLKEFKGIKILSPAEFLSTMNMNND